MGHNDAVKLGSEYIQCILFADDIVLLSSRKEDLQTCMDNLHRYCNKWKLEVNINKNKIIIFNKTGRLLRDYFVECVKHTDTWV